MTTAGSVSRPGSGPASGPARTRTAPSPARERSLLRQVAVPSEHGGWSLTAEPIVLGLAVAWSAPGVLLGAAAMLAFLARTPVKLVLVDLWRHRWLRRTRVAAVVAGVEVAAIALAVVGASLLADSASFWLPLLAAAPLVVVELWFDMRSRGRRLLPELAGTVGIGSVAAAIALAGGADTALALGLWCVIGARGAAAIPAVRSQIMRMHGRPAHVAQSDVAQALAVAAVALAWWLDAAPFASLVALTVVGVVNLVVVRRPPPRVALIGIQQMLFGLAVVAVTAVAV